MSVQRCMAETTSSEFVDWVSFRRTDMNNPSRIDYYLAQIAAEVRRSNVKHPNKITVKDFLLKFTPKSNPNKPPTQDEITKRSMASKSMWMGILKKARKPPEGKK